MLVNFFGINRCSLYNRIRFVYFLLVNFLTTEVKVLYALRVFVMR